MFSCVFLCVFAPIAVVKCALLTEPTHNNSTKQANDQITHHIDEPPPDQSNAHTRTHEQFTLFCRNSNTGLDADGMRELCLALRSNSSLTDLNLSRNRFGEEGAALLEETLDSAPALQSLDVRRFVGGCVRVRRCVLCLFVPCV